MKPHLLVPPCLALLSLASVPGAQPWLASDVDVDIEIDARGVPHITSETDEGAFYGAGYICARERLFQMQYSRRKLQGRLAELIGNIVTSKGSVIELDTEHWRFGYYESAVDRAAELDAQTQAYLRAYADGVNEYLAELDDPGGWDPNGNHPRLVHRPEDWTVADCLAIWDVVALNFLNEAKDEARHLNDFEYHLENLPPSDPATVQELTQAAIDTVAASSANLVWHDEGAVLQVGDLPVGKLAEMQAYADTNPPAGDPDPVYAPPTGGGTPKFSHGFAAADGITAGSSSILYSNPQVPITTPSLFHEVELTGQSFSVRGVTFPGCPGIFIGSTDDVAWGIASLGADVTDLFLVNASEVPVTTELKTLKVLDTDDQSATYLQLLDHDEESDRMTTPYGPVADDYLPLNPNTTDNLDLVEDDHFAQRTIGLWEQNEGDGERHTLQAVFRMIQARNTAQLQSAIEAWRTPTAHLFYGDANGKAGYSVATAMPQRSNELHLAGWMAHDLRGLLTGSYDPTYDWQGYVPPYLLPRATTTTGSFIVANQAPAGQWYPLWIGVSGVGDSHRSWRLRELLEPFEQSGGLDIVAAEAIHRDTVMSLARDFVEFGLLIEANYLPWHDVAWTDEARWALDYLEGWFVAGAKMELDPTDPSAPESAVLLAHFMKPKFKGLTEAAMQPEVGETLLCEFGSGNNGLIAMFQDLRSRLNDPELFPELGVVPPDPSDGHTLDEAAVLFIGLGLHEAWRLVTQSGALEVNPVLTECTGVPPVCPTPADLIAMSDVYTNEILTRTFKHQKHDGFGSLATFLGATGGSPFDLSYVLECANERTVRASGGQAWTQLVDFGPSARVLHPLGNSERPTPLYNANKDEWTAGDLIDSDAAAIDEMLTLSLSRDYYYYGDPTPAPRGDFISIDLSGPITITETIPGVPLFDFDVVVSNARASSIYGIRVGDASDLTGGLNTTNQFWTKDEGFKFIGTTTSAGEIVRDLNSVHPRSGERLPGQVTTGDELFIQVVVKISPGVWSASGGILVEIQ